MQDDRQLVLTLPRSIPVEKYPMALNAFLPIDIRVQSAHLMPSGFSARFNATSRSYRYFLSTSQSPQLFLCPIAGHYTENRM